LSRHPTWRDKYEASRHYLWRDRLAHVSGPLAQRRVGPPAWQPCRAKRDGVTEATCRAFTDGATKLNYTAQIKSIAG